MECSRPATEGSRHVRAYSCRKFLFIPGHGRIVGSFIPHSPRRNQLIWSAHCQPLRGRVMSGPIHVGVSLHPRPWRNSRKFHYSQSMEESVNVECSLPATEGSRHVRAYSCRKFLLIPDHGGIAGSSITHSPWRDQLIA
jgi:hypothetical protein